MSEETTPSSEPAEPTKPTGEQKDVEENKAMAVVAYLGILCLIPLLAKKDSPYAQFHAKQGLVLFIVGIIVGIISAIPFIGWVIAPLGGIFVFVLMIIGIMNAVQGKMKELPIIGQFGKKFNF